MRLSFEDYPSFLQANISVNVDEYDSTTSYVGYALPGVATTEAKWIIKKITTTGGVTQVTWADGDDKADNVWDDRLGLNYA